MKMQLTLFLLLALTPSAALAKGGEERWIAADDATIAITGDILLSPSRLVIAGKSLPLKVAADIREFRNRDGESVSARVLQVTKPSYPKLLHGNWFCGIDNNSPPIRWIAVWHDDRGLVMDVFPSKNLPTDSSNGCGDFHYERP
jgi:hypothetical protein